MLDRLLDDADAHRSIEPIVPDVAEELRDSPAIASGHHAAESRVEQPARRGASVLRDRATVARKAFNRADALVELAQGYLRGDRPDRSPIEVTLTVPASLLHDELADPVEVGEIGESFVSRETARRLSCDAGVVEIIEDDQGTPLSVGRKRRTIVFHFSMRKLPSPLLSSGRITSLTQRSSVSCIGGSRSASLPFAIPAGHSSCLGRSQAKTCSKGFDERCARSLRKVELEIISSQFGPVIDAKRLAEMRKDLADLERILESELSSRGD